MTKLQATVFISFSLGALFGASLFEEAFGVSSLLVPVVTISPLWLTGICILLHQRCSSNAQNYGISLHDTPPTTPISPPTSSTSPPLPSSSPSSSPSPPPITPPPFPSANASLARLPIIEDEFPEFESEGLGVRIMPLPRLNILEDPDCTMDTTTDRSSRVLAVPGEYERLPYSHFAWKMYFTTFLLRCAYL